MQAAVLLVFWERLMTEATELMRRFLGLLLFLHFCTIHDNFRKGHLGEYNGIQDVLGHGHGG
jgi:hypothetical protein